MNKNNIENLEAKLTTFAVILNAQQLEGLKARGCDCEANRNNVATSVKIGPKYSKVDIGGSGRYMVVNSTGEIFGIKAYGVIHRGHAYGTLDTVGDWDWSQYRAFPLPEKDKASNQAFIASPEGKELLGLDPSAAYNKPAPAPQPSAPKATPPAAATLKPGDRVSATVYGVLKHGTVDHVSASSIVFVRFDGAKSFTWAHRESLTKIEPAAPAVSSSVKIVFPEPVWLRLDEENGYGCFPAQVYEVKITPRENNHVDIKFPEGVARGVFNDPSVFIVIDPKKSVAQTLVEADGAGIGTQFGNALLTIAIATAKEQLGIS